MLNELFEPFGDTAGVESSRAHRPSLRDDHAEIALSAARGGVDRFRDAVRGVADLRRGAAVIVTEGDDALVCAVAETVEPARLAELREWAASGPVLIRPVGGDCDGSAPRLAAVELDPGEVDAAVLRELAPMSLEALIDVARPESGVPKGAGAAILLAKLAHLLPTLIASRIDHDGLAQARAAGAIIVESADIEALRAAGTRLVRVGEARVPLEDAGDARIVAFRNPESGAEHIAVLIGAPEHVAPGDLAPLVRLHSECFTGDVLGSLRCDCGPQLRAAMRRMADEGAGVVLYLAQEGRGIGLLNKLRSYVLQDRGLDTVDANAALGYGADERDFTLAASMLRELGLLRVRLLTNNPAKVAALIASGIAVDRASLLIAPNGVNDEYLATKAARFGHLLG